MNIITLVNFLVSYLMQFNDWSVTSSFGVYTFSVNIYDEEKDLADNLIKILKSDLITDNTIFINIDKDLNSDTLDITIND